MCTVNRCKQPQILPIKPKRKNPDNFCYLSPFSNAGDGAQDVQWTSALRRPKRSVDLELGFKARSASNAKWSRHFVYSICVKCRRWDLNPHKRIAYKILSLARLPVPTLLHKPHTIMKSCKIQSG